MTSMNKAEALKKLQAAEADLDKVLDAYEYDNSLWSEKLQHENRVEKAYQAWKNAPD